jgi:di/tricarboxylate transporter
LPIIAVPLIGIDDGTDARGRLVCATEGLCRGAITDPLANERVLNLGDLGAHYANPIVLLYIGGFLLGIAIERWGLSTRIAYGLVARGGANPKLMLAGFLLAAGIISMWISNTSTSLILTPLALSVAAGSAVEGRVDSKFAAARWFWPSPTPPRLAGWRLRSARRPTASPSPSCARKASRCRSASGWRSACRS